MRVQPRRSSKQEYYNLKLPKKGETFHPGLIRCLKPGIRLLERGCQKSHQCKSKSIIIAIFRYPRDRRQVSSRAEANKKRSRL